MMVITLIGYRGTGKSTLAPLLAARLGWAWVDADAEIERAAGLTIREIFARETEAGFRIREHAVLEELLSRDKLVLAAGGGAILDPRTRARMQDAGPVVWLKAPVEILAARIACDATTADRRPNLAGGGLAEISRLLELREPLYRECATLEVEAASAYPEELACQILSRLIPIPQPA